MINHRQAQVLLPGYALGALELREQDDLLEHLQTCSACYQLAQEQAELSARLAGGIAEAAPPAGLRTRVLDSLARIPFLDATRAAAARPSIFARIVLTVPCSLRLMFK